MHFTTATTMFPNISRFSSLIQRNIPILLFQRWKNVLPFIFHNQLFLNKSDSSIENNVFNSFQKRYSTNTTNALDKLSEGLENIEEKDDILYKTIILEARSADRGVLDSYEKFVVMTAKFLDIPVSRVWEPYRSIKRRTLLRSAFVKKKYRVQYEFRTYFRCVEIKFLTGSTADTFLEYIERNLPEGTALKVTRHQIEKIPSHLKPPENDQINS